MINNTLHKATLIILILLFSLVSIFAIGVDSKELQSASGDIVFINYNGPHSQVNTIDEIKSIGTQMGSLIKNNRDTSINVGNASKYRIIHAVDSSVKEKLDADILILGADANVDHINNLRLIISGYLQEAYSYSASDASTLATFITVYNAVYRNKLDIFNSKYKTVVTNNLANEFCGLSVNYSEWAGKTQIVIPLSDISGGISTIDTSVISDKQVIDSIRETDDKGIDERKNLVDIKEREADQATEKAQTAQKQATETQKKAVEETNKAKEEQQKLAVTKKEAEAAQKKADENPNDKKAQEDAKKAQEEVKKQEEVVENQQEKAKETQEEATKQREEATEQQVIADKKRTEAQEDRKDIASDQTELIKEASKQTNVVTSYGLKLVDEANLLSALVLVDIKTGNIVKESPVNVIRNRMVVPSGNKYIAIAGKSGGNATIKLVTLDTENMEITGESTEVIAAESVLVPVDNAFYVVVQESTNYYIARFGSDLKLNCKSELKVNPSTPIVVTSSGVSVTDSTGVIKLLETKTLKEIK